MPRPAAVRYGVYLATQVWIFAVSVPAAVMQVLSCPTALSCGLWSALWTWACAARSAFAVAAAMLRLIAAPRACAAACADGLPHDRVRDAGGDHEGECETGGGTEQAREDRACAELGEAAGREQTRDQPGSTKAPPNTAA